MPAVEGLVSLRPDPSLEKGCQRGQNNVRILSFKIR